MAAHETKSRDDQVDAAVAEFLEAADRGDAPQCSEWLRRYPHLTVELNEFFDAYQMKKSYSASVVSSLNKTTAHTPGSSGHTSKQMPDPFPGEFRFVRLLGEGAFGKVYLADDVNLGWQVAIKTLKLPIESTFGPETLAALKKEARQLAMLRHPNIVRVHAWREAGGQYFLVQQYVPGGSLADRLKAEKQLSWQDAAKYVADIGEALVETHKRGIIHRDIKPDNILWDAGNDEALLADFGVSARLAEPGSAAGTPIYMAPESFAGHVSPALDVYSLSATLFRLVTGKLPFEKETIPDLIHQKCLGLIDPDPRCNSIPEPLERIIRAGLMAEPEKRPKLDDFVSGLRAVLNQLLADDLIPKTNELEKRPGAILHITVSRLRRDDSYEPLEMTHPKPTTLERDMRKVPRTPDQVQIHTGDCVRIEATVDQPGFLVVFNIGPTGNFNLLYPDELPAHDSLPNVRANHPLQVLDVMMTPPIGHERVVAIWSRKPLNMSLDAMYGHVQENAIFTSQSYLATRDMKRLRKSICELPTDQWQVAVLELEHQPQH